MFSSLKRTALLQLTQVWIHEAVFGVRKFHADLHPGNIFFAPPAEDQAEDDYVLTLLDFGSMGAFSISEAKALVKILIGLSYGMEALTFQGLTWIANWPRSDQMDAAIHAMITELLTSPDIAVGERSKEFFNRCIELGIELPTSVIQFHRGLAFLEAQITDSYQTEYGKIEGQKEATQAMGKLFGDVFKRDLLWDLFSTACEAQDNCSAYVDNQLLGAFFKKIFGF
jgi:predicted unusual protein kinase regulating ubiquinone biosynthesis (AarF/ABC1/UbiB family)